MSKNTVSLRNSIKLNAESLFQVVKARSTSEELVIICPQPGCGDRSGNRSINLKTGATNCWRCNKASRNFFQWCRQLGYEVDEDGVDTGMTATDAQTMLGNVGKHAKVLVPVVSGIRLPQGFETCADNPKSVYTRLIGEMAVKKHLRLDDMLEAGVGFTRNNPRWEPYAIFPVLEWQRVVYFQGRKYRSKPGESTKLFPTRQEAPLSSKYWIYGLDELRSGTASTAIVVESILNVLSLRKELRKRGQLNQVVPVCVFKHAISQPQLIKLLGVKHLKEVCLMFDRDALKASWDQASRLADRKRVTIAELPDIGEAKLDANDDVELALQVFDTRSRFSDSSRLLRQF